MKTLLLMAEDGISGHVWLEMAKQHLQRGRLVLAITDDSDLGCAVGTGDDCPTFYHRELLDEPGFTARAVGVGDVALLLEELCQLPSNVVVMFNISPFELAARDERWIKVIDCCALMTNEQVFSYYYPWSQWPHDLDQMLTLSLDEQAPHRWAGLGLLQRAAWDYVAGSRVIFPHNLAALKACFPSLEHGVELPDTRGLPPVQVGWDGTVPWQIINHSGSYEVHLPLQRVHTMADAYPPLWDVRYPHVTIPATQPD